MSIETFELVKERCLLSHLNVRTEMHGDERDPACDLKFEISTANNLLAKLHAGLRDALYRADDNKDIDADHKPHLRFPLLGTLPYELEIPRTLLRIHDVDDPANDVVLGGGKTNNFKLTPMEGGTVKWSFRCQFSKPDEDMVAKLMRALNQTVPISLSCADEEKKGDNFDQVEKVTKEEHSPAREKAESLFDKPAGDDPDFREVKDELQKDGAPKDGEVVDATFVAAAAPAASSVTSISKGRGKRTATGGATVE